MAVVSDSRTLCSTKLVPKLPLSRGFSCTCGVTDISESRKNRLVLGGRASIRGMRIPVSVIVGQIAHGASFEETLQGFPDLEREDIEQALQHAAWLTQEPI